LVSVYGCCCMVVVGVSVWLLLYGCCLYDKAEADKT
jgi:hypothetical protein